MVAEVKQDRGRIASALAGMPKSITLLMAAGGAMLLLHLTDQASAQTIQTYSEASFDDELIRNAVGNILRLIEGSFGALIMVVAGIISIIAAALGQFRHALAMLVVAVGAFILRSLVSLFFGVDYTAYDAFLSF